MAGRHQILQLRNKNNCTPRFASDFSPVAPDFNPPNSGRPLKLKCIRKLRSVGETVDHDIVRMVIKGKQNNGNNASRERRVMMAGRSWSRQNLTITIGGAVLMLQYCSAMVLNLAPISSRLAAGLPFLQSTSKSRSLRALLAQDVDGDTTGEASTVAHIGANTDLEDVAAGSTTTTSCPHFVIEALGDTTPADYFQFVNSRSMNPEEDIQDVHQSTYREIGDLCRSIFLKGTELKDAKLDGVTGDTSALETSFQPYEIRRRRENRRLLNEMFLAYELKLATDDDRKDYEKQKKQMEKQEYWDLQQQQPPQQRSYVQHPSRSNNNHHQHRRQQPFQQQQQPTSFQTSSFRTVPPDNPYPQHSYDWEREEHSRRHSQQYQQQKELQKEFIQRNMGTGGTGSESDSDSSGGYNYDPFHQGMRQPPNMQQRHPQQHPTSRRPGRNVVPIDDDDEGDRGRYQYRSYNQNPYLHEEPLVMGGNLGGTSARSGRRPPSPNNDRHRRSPPTSFPRRGGRGPTGPLFAHDPFLSNVFGHADDIPYRTRQRHEEQLQQQQQQQQQGRSNNHHHLTGKGAPSNNHIWGVEDPHAVDNQHQGTVVVEENGGYYEYPYGMATQVDEPVSTHSQYQAEEQNEHQQQQPQPERELYREAMESSRIQQQKEAQERSQQKHFYEQGDKLYVRGPLVGFVEVSNIPYNLGRVEDLEYAKAGMRSPKRPVVTHLAVEQRARKSGIGSRLLEACERHVQQQWNAKELILEVEESEDDVDQAKDTSTAGHTGSIAVINFLNKRGYEILFAEPASQRYDPAAGEVLEQIQRRKDVMHKVLVNKKQHWPVDDFGGAGSGGSGDSRVEKQAEADKTRSRHEHHAGLYDVVDVEYFESVEISDGHSDGVDEHYSVGTGGISDSPPADISQRDSTGESASSIESEPHRPRRKSYELPVDYDMI